MLNIQNELSKFLGIDKQLLKLNNEYDMSKINRYIGQVPIYASNN